MLSFLSIILLKIAAGSDSPSIGTIELPFFTASTVTIVSNKITNETTEKLSSIAEIYHTKLQKGFDCAMENIKTYGELCYNIFGLQNHHLDLSEETLEYPAGVEKLMTISDIGIIRRPGEKFPLVTFAYEKNESMQISYIKWFKAVTLKCGENNSTAEVLKNNLDEYYEKNWNKTENVNDTNYKNKTAFCKLFAFTISRWYKLGCVWKNDLVKLINDRVMCMNDTVDEELIFTEALLEHMPRWYMTDEDIDLINIFWKSFGFSGPLKVGKRITNKINEEVIIPIMDTCLSDTEVGVTT